MPQTKQSLVILVCLIAIIDLVACAASSGKNQVANLTRLGECMGTKDLIITVYRDPDDGNLFIADKNAFGRHNKSLVNECFKEQNLTTYNFLVLFDNWMQGGEEVVAGPASSGLLTWDAADTLRPSYQKSYRDLSTKENNFTAGYSGNISIGG